MATLFTMNKDLFEFLLTFRTLLILISNVSLLARQMCREKMVAYVMHTVEKGVFSSLTKSFFPSSEVRRRKNINFPFCRHLVVIMITVFNTLLKLFSLQELSSS